MPSIVDDWYIAVYEPDGTLKKFLRAGEEPLIEVSWSLTGPGLCVEMEFAAIPRDLSVQINARDVVGLFINTGGGLQQKFEGVCTIAGDPRSDDVQIYRVQPYNFRFYEILIDEDIINGGDVAGMVEDILFTADLRPDAMTYYRQGGPASPESSPVTNFTLGDRYPGYESVGEFLDDMASTVGSFVVPSGETYTYEGVTYNAGDTVPKVVWGTTEEGLFRFFRPQQSAVLLNESSRRVEVDWTRISGEEAYDRTTLLYGDYAYTEEYLFGSFRASYSGVDYTNYAPSDVPFRPIARTFTKAGGVLESTRRVVLTNALDFMVDVANLLPNPDTYNISNPSNAVDGNDTTYASVSSGPGYVAVNAAVEEGIVRLLFKKNTGSDLASLRCDWYVGTVLKARLTYQFDDINNDQLVEFLVPMPKPIGLGVAAIDTLEVQAGGDFGVRIYSLEIQVPDVDDGGTSSEKLAEAYFRAPVDTAASVSYWGLGTASPTLELTTEAGGALLLPVERVEYTLTREQGLKTIYKIGEAYDPDLAAERAVLGRIAKEAVKR